MNCRVIRMSYKSLIIAIFFVFLSGCDREGGSDANDVKGKLVIPLFKECKEFVSTYLDKTPKSVGLSYSFVNFDYVPGAAPTIVGYVEISSVKQNKKQLLPVANSFILGCYPESKTTIRKDEDKAGELLLDTLRLNSRIGNEKSYIVDDGNNIHIYSYK